tara:strand:- start:124 stop:405 length:282 start_codon:yes stop_codon:yes gene_type:complete
MVEETSSQAEEREPTEEEYEEVALFAIGRLRVQDLIDDAVKALVVLYKSRPESYEYDKQANRAYNEDQDVDYLESPFMDLIAHLLEVYESTRD